jgi:dual specificity MAP kinase phosphatase
MPGRSTTPPPHLTLNTSSRGTPAAVPNKHLPVCSPGPVPRRGLDTPPASPPNKDSVIETASITYPPNKYCTEFSQDPPLFAITAQRTAQALEHMATQPLPNTEQVFPWLHGLHADNQIQLAFFTHRRKRDRQVPKCIRSLTIVKTGGDLSKSKLKGAIAPEELLPPAPESNAFIECDPKDGFSVRNFQIQACKLAMVSDIIVYGDDKTNSSETLALARRISKAQRQYEANNRFPRCFFNTFVLSGGYQSRIRSLARTNSI